MDTAALVTLYILIAYVGIGTIFALVVAVAEGMEFYKGGDPITIGYILSGIFQVVVLGPIFGTLVLWETIDWSSISDVTIIQKRKEP